MWHQTSDCHVVSGAVHRTVLCVFCFVVERPTRSTCALSSAASAVYKRQGLGGVVRAVLSDDAHARLVLGRVSGVGVALVAEAVPVVVLSLIHISEPTRPY